MTTSDDRSLPERLTADLQVARKARDRTATTALRTALGALANAEAPAFDAAEDPEGRGELVEHERLVLSADRQVEIVRSEVARREQQIAELEGSAVAAAHVEELRAEVAVLVRYLA